MANSYPLAGSPDTIERRSHYRQRLASSRIELGENNHGIVVNISQTGLALQTSNEMTDDELPKMRFQFPESEVWIEAKGRIKWKSDSQKVAGVEFLDLSAETRKQIEMLIFLYGGSELAREQTLPEKTKPVGEAIPVAETISEIPLAEARTLELVFEDPFQAPLQAEVQLPGEAQIAASDSECAVVENVADETVAETVPEERCAGPIVPPIPLPAEPQIPKTVSERPVTKDATHYFGRMRRSIGLTLAAILLALAVVPVWHYWKGRSSQKGKGTPEPNRAVLASTIPTAPIASPARIADHPVPAVKPRPSGEPAFVLQVGAMVREDNAKALVDSLNEMKFPAFVLKKSSDRFHRVVVGPYNDLDALRTKGELEKRGFKVIRTEWKAQAR